MVKFVHETRAQLSGSSGRVIRSALFRLLPAPSSGVSQHLSSDVAERSDSFSATRFKLIADGRSLLFVGISTSSSSSFSSSSFSFSFQFQLAHTFNKSSFRKFQGRLQPIPTPISHPPPPPPLTRFPAAIPTPRSTLVRYHIFTPGSAIPRWSSTFSTVIADSPADSPADYFDRGDYRGRDFFGWPGILWDSWGFFRDSFGILSDILRFFFRIFGEFSGFLGNFRDSWGFFEILSDILRFFWDFSGFFGILGFFLRIL